MPDSKITALTALTAADPANDMIPIVDVSDTPPASGNTKRISINNILACSPSATLASATITGDLTVDTSTLKVDSTNNRVGILTASPLYPLHLVGEFGLQEETPAGSGTKLRLIGDATKFNFRLGKQLTATNTFEITPSTAAGGTTFSNPVYTVTYDGIHTFLDGAGGTRMTLNANGLGVGVVANRNLDIRQDQSAATTARIQNQSVNAAAYSELNISASGNNWGIRSGSTAANSNRLEFVVDPSGTNLSVMRLDTSGNVGVGVTPSAWQSPFKAIELSGGSISANNTASLRLVQNAFFNSGAWLYKTTAAASRYEQEAAGHYWFTSNNTPSAGTTATFTQAMTLDASGNLLVGGTSGSFRGTFLVAGGANRDILIAGVTGVSGGFQVKWNNSTSKINVIIENIPTSSAGLAAGTLWNDAGTIKIA
jgi:hypothetical protein